MQPSRSQLLVLVAIATALALSVACSGSDRGRQGPVGETVATVNGVEISTQSLSELVQADSRASRANGKETPEETRSRLLGILIGRELMFQDARALGLEVDAQRLEDRVSKARSQFATDEEFQDYLAASGQDVEDIRKKGERILLVAQYANQVAGDVVVDEAEARAAYEERKDEYMDSEMLHAHQIFIPVKRTGDSEVNNRNALELAEKVRGRVLAGEPFAELAHKYSTGPSNPQGGDMGFFPRGRWFKEFDDVVFEAEVGELLPVFRTSLGYHIVKILERRPPQVKPFDEVKNSLIMVLTSEKREALLDERLARLRADATIEILDPALQATP